MPGVLESIPGLGGYVGGQNEDQKLQLGQLQSMGLLQGIVAKQRQAQMEQMFRQEISQAKTPEEQASVAAKYGDPTHILQNATRVQGQKATQEMAMARLQSAAQNFQQNYQLRYSAAKTQEERLVLDQQKAQFEQQLKGEAARLAGAQANYNFGFMPGTPPAPTVGAPTAPQGTSQWGPVASGTPPEVQAAAAQIRGNLAQGGPGGSVDLGVLPNQPASPAAPVAAPQATPSPAPVTPASAPMPPEVARMPQKYQDQWRLAQAKQTSLGELTPEAITSAAARYRIDGTLPTNLGRGNQGAANTAKILNEAAASAKAEGNTPEAQRLTQIAGHATTQALTQLGVQEAKMRAFEGTFRRNVDLVESLSAKVDRTGTPVVNRWIQAGQRAIAGDVDLVNFDAAVKGAVNEYAKIVSSATGSGVTAEGEIKKVEELLSTKQTKEQVIGVLTTLRKETQNRMDAFQEEKQNLKNSLRLTPAAPQGSAPQAAIDYLRANPATKDAFKAKYGFLPSGI